MIFDILDPQGTADLRLGMPKSDVRALLGEWREFHRTTESPASDQFVAAGVLVTYDECGRVSVIEFADPASPRLSGALMLGLTVSQLRESLTRLGLHVDLDVDVILVPSWRMSFYAPDEKVAGLLLGE